METKLKKKTIEQSGVRKGSPMEGVGSVYGGKDLRKRYSDYMFTLNRGLNTSTYHYNHHHRHVKEIE